MEVSRFGIAATPGGHETARLVVSVYVFSTTRWLREGRVRIIGEDNHTDWVRFATNVELVWWRRG